MNYSSIVVVVLLFQISPAGYVLFIWIFKFASVFFLLFLIGLARRGCVCNRVVRHVGVITFPSVLGLK